MDTILHDLAEVLAQRKSQASVDTSYVASLHQRGLNRILEKVGEEATETIIAAKELQAGGSREALVGEVADLWFHSMVMLSHLDIELNEVSACLAGRMGLSGLVEKAGRGQ